MRQAEEQWVLGLAMGFATAAHAINAGRRLGIDLSAGYA